MGVVVVEVKLGITQVLYSVLEYPYTLCILYDIRMGGSP